MVIQLKVNLPRGVEKIIGLCDSEEQLKKITVLQLKLKIINELYIGGDLRIVFRAATLEEEAFLVSCGIRHMSTIHTLLRLPGGM